MRCIAFQCRKLERLNLRWLNCWFRNALIIGIGHGAEHSTKRPYLIGTRRPPSATKHFQAANHDPTSPAPAKATMNQIKAFVVS